MSGVLRRSVLMGKHDGVHIFCDWAICTTGIGTMVEPFEVNIHHVGNVDMPSELEPTDMMRRIDNILSMDASGYVEMINGGNTGEKVHDGASWIRSDVRGG